MDNATDIVRRGDHGKNKKYSKQDTHHGKRSGFKAFGDES
jgi:hypothetical protein